MPSRSRHSTAKNVRPNETMSEKSHAAPGRSAITKGFSGHAAVQRASGVAPLTCFEKKNHGTNAITTVATRMASTVALARSSLIVGNVSNR